MFGIESHSWLTRVDLLVTALAVAACVTTGEIDSQERANDGGASGDPAPRTSDAGKAGGRPIGTGGMGNHPPGPGSDAATEVGGASGQGGQAGDTGSGGNNAAGAGGAGGATVCLNSDGAGGRDPYGIISSVLGFDSIEYPDNDHSPPFRHIRGDTDSEVGNHFVFFMHRDIDKDPVTNAVDRQRCEIKVFYTSSSALRGVEGSTFTYTWRFKINPEMTVSGDFTHFFQLKSEGGDDSAPIVTITGEDVSGSDHLELRHSASSTGSADTLDQTSWSAVRGIWLEVEVHATFADSGSLSMKVKKPDGSVILSTSKTKIDLWRAGTYIRPKWGIYRGLTDKKNLRAQEETVRFANFAITRGATPSSDCKTP